MKQDLGETEESQGEFWLLSPRNIMGRTLETAKRWQRQERACVQVKNSQEKCRRFWLRLLKSTFLRICPALWRPKEGSDPSPGGPQAPTTRRPPLESSPWEVTMPSGRTQWAERQPTQLWPVGVSLFWEGAHQASGAPPAPKGEMSRVRTR